jgi:hypothetical protein
MSQKTKWFNPSPPAMVIYPAAAVKLTPEQLQCLFTALEHKTLTARR